MSKTPLKGLPDFTKIPTEKLKEYIDLAQQMIFAYNHCDEEKTRVLTEVWKQMSDEYTDRHYGAVIESLDNEPKPVVHKIRPVKKIKR